MVKWKDLRGFYERWLVTTLDQTRTQREREVENALASVRMEGLEISSEARSIFRQYVDGDLSSEELDCAFDRYFDRSMGPYVYPGTSRT